MLIYLYRFLINIVFILSPIIIISRLTKKKEDFKRFKEKFCFFSQKRGKGKLIWFHGSSVGEILSIIPLVEKEIEASVLRGLLRPGKNSGYLFRISGWLKRKLEGMSQK